LIQEFFDIDIDSMINCELALYQLLILWDESGNSEATDKNDPQQIVSSFEKRKAHDRMDLFIKWYDLREDTKESPE
jgi:hypothetical protein